MPSHDDQILRILREATEPLFPSETTERLNRELGGAGYTMTQVAMRLASLKDQVVQLPDGRWTLKRRVA